MIKTHLNVTASPTVLTIDIDRCLQGRKTSEMRGIVLRSSSHGHEPGHQEVHFVSRFYVHALEAGSPERMTSKKANR